MGDSFPDTFLPPYVVAWTLSGPMFFFTEKPLSLSYFGDCHSFFRVFDMYRLWNTCATTHPALNPWKQDAISQQP
jgi:hypothetical protein